MDQMITSFLHLDIRIRISIIDGELARFSESSSSGNTRDWEGNAIVGYMNGWMDRGSV